MAEIGPIRREITIEPIPQTAPKEEPSPEPTYAPEPDAPSVPSSPEKVPV